jgi:hypothetical protein
VSDTKPETTKNFSTKIFSLFGGAAFGALFGIAGTIYAATAGFLNKDRELDIEMTRVALTILSEANTADADDKLEPQRKFAVRALEKFSGIEIDEYDFDTWARDGIVPKVATTTVEVCAGLAHKFANGEPDYSLKSFSRSEAYINMYFLGCLKEVTRDDALKNYDALVKIEEIHDQMMEALRKKYDEDVAAGRVKPYTPSYMILPQAHPEIRVIRKWPPSLMPPS